MAADKISEDNYTKANQWLVRLQSPDLEEHEIEAFFLWLNKSPEHQAAYIEAEKFWGSLDELKKLSIQQIFNSEQPSNVIQLKKFTETAARDTHPSALDTSSDLFTGDAGNKKTVTSNIPVSNNPGLNAIIQQKKTAHADLTPSQPSVNKQKQRHQHWSTRIKVLAASLAACFIIFTFMLGSDTTLNQFQTQLGEQQHVTLQDGSQVHLNTQSHLVFNMQSQSRFARLEQGEAFFDIAHDQEKPFLVKTPSGTIRVLGTKFNVKINNDETVVTVIEGKVGVSNEENIDTLLSNSFQPTAVLIKNQELKLSTQHLQPYTVNALSTSTWRTGRQIYQGEPLSQVISDLNRYFARKILLGDQTLADMEIVAVLNIRNREQAVNVLETTLNLQAVTNNTGQVILYAKGEHESRKDTLL